MSNAEVRPPTPLEEYDLKLDEQAENFLEVSQKLAFYLVGAAVASLAFTLSHAASHGIRERAALWMLILGSAAAVSTVGVILLSLWKQIDSYRMHLSVRTRRLTYDQLPAAMKDRWNGLNRGTKRLQKVGFAGLALAIVFQAAFFLLALVPERDTMHHFGEDSTYVVDQGDHFLVILRNKVTNRAVTMTIPKSGLREMPGADVDQALAEAVAHEVAHMLRQRLQ